MSFVIHDLFAWRAQFVIATPSIHYSALDMLCHLRLSNGVRYIIHMVLLIIRPICSMSILYVLYVRRVLHSLLNWYILLEVSALLLLHVLPVRLFAPSVSVETIGCTNTHKEARNKKQTQ